MASLLSFVFFAVLVSLTVADVWISPTGTANGAGTQNDPILTIQGGVDKAIATSDSLVRAVAGVYNCSVQAGNCNVGFGGRTITIRSESGALSTIIYGTGVPSPSSAFFFTNTSARPTIDGFTISNHAGCGIKSNVTLDYFLLNNSIVSNNFALSENPAAGVKIKTSLTSTVLIQNSEFSDNQGVAVYIVSLISSTPQVNVSNSRFLRNSYTNLYGCGISTDRTVSLTVSDTVFIKNRGAIFSSSGALRLTNNQFYGNYDNTSGSTQAFALRCSTTAPMPVNSGNNFCGYYNGFAGNGISCASYATSGGSSILTDYDGCSVCGGNNAAKDCNGICWGPGTSCRTKVTWYVAPGASGDGTTSGTPAALTDAISWAGYGDTIMMLNGTYNSGISPISLGGKAITLTSYDGLPESVFYNASVGTAFNIHNGESYDTVFKGLYIFGASGSSAVTVAGASPTFSHCRFSENQAGDGAGIYLTDSFAKVDNCVFDNNIGTYGTAIFIGSSGVNTPSYLTLSRTRFISNYAFSASGGALGLGTFTTAIVTYNHFEFNNSTVSGAAIYLSATTDTIKASYNSFRVNDAPSTNDKSVSCPSTAKATSSNNVFCGSTPSTGFVSCTTNWNSVGTLGTADDCGVCNGGNANKDCHGVCFGYAVSDGAGGCCEVSQRVGGVCP